MWLLFNAKKSRKTEISYLCVWSEKLDNQNSDIRFNQDRIPDIQFSFFFFLNNLTFSHINILAHMVFFFNQAIFLNFEYKSFWKYSLIFKSIN